MKKQSTKACSKGSSLRSSVRKKIISTASNKTAEHELLFIEEEQLNVTKVIIFTYSNLIRTMEVSGIDHDFEDVMHGVTPKVILFYDIEVSDTSASDSNVYDTAN